MPSFDIVLEPDLVELRNAVEQANKEIGTRFDFKGSSAQVLLTDRGATERDITLLADSDFQLGQVRDVLLGRLAKRNVDVRFFDFAQPPVKRGGDTLEQPVEVKTGIDAETARKISTLLKGSKLKVQGQLQGDVVRVSGAKRDELQLAIALVRRELTALPLAFRNMRE